MSQVHTGGKSCFNFAIITFTFSLYSKEYQFCWIDTMINAVNCCLKAKNIKFDFRYCYTGCKKAYYNCIISYYSSLHQIHGWCNFTSSDRSKSSIISTNYRYDKRIIKGFQQRRLSMIILFPYSSFNNHGWLKWWWYAWLLAMEYSFKYISRV